MNLFTKILGFSLFLTDAKPETIWHKFWEINITFNDLMIQIGLITILILFGNVIRRKVGFIRKSLLPTAIIGGIIFLLLKQIPFVYNLINNDFLEAVTYHTLALGCIAIALKSTGLDQIKEKKSKIADAGLITVNTYLLQGLIGGTLTLLLFYTFYGHIERLFVAGLLLPLGFGQGSGQALNFGSIFENYWGLKGGASLGLTIAAVGFLSACMVGLIHLNVFKKKGLLTRKSEEATFVSNEEISSPNEIPLTESVDRFTIQLALIALVYFLAFLFIGWFSSIEGGDMMTNTLQPLIIGFNFLIGTIFAILLRSSFKFLKKVNLMNRIYPNNYLLNRFAGFMFDLMIIAGIGAIEISVLRGLLIPLVIIILVGTVVTYFYVRFVAVRLFPNYKEEAFISLFGTLTGTTSTGLILLREIDPKYETPAATNLIFLSLYAIAFGFPLFLLLGIAPQGVDKMILALIIIASMFVIYNAVLFRRKIFKSHYKNKE